MTKSAEHVSRKIKFMLQKYEILWSDTYTLSWRFHLVLGFSRIFTCLTAGGQKKVKRKGWNRNSFFMLGDTAARLYNCPFAQSGAAAVVKIVQQTLKLAEFFLCLLVRRHTHCCALCKKCRLSLIWSFINSLFFSCSVFATFFSLPLLHCGRLLLFCMNIPPLIHFEYLLCRTWSFSDKAETTNGRENWVATSLNSLSSWWWWSSCKTAIWSLLSKDENKSQQTIASLHLNNVNKLLRLSLPHFLFTVAHTSQHTLQHPRVLDAVASLSSPCHFTFASFSLLLRIDGETCFRACSPHIGWVGWWYRSSHSHNLSQFNGRASRKFVWID